MGQAGSGGIVQITVNKMEGKLETNRSYPPQQLKDAGVTDAAWQSFVDNYNNDLKAFTKVFKIMPFLIGPEHFGCATGHDVSGS